MSAAHRPKGRRIYEVKVPTESGAWRNRTTKTRDRVTARAMQAMVDSLGAAGKGAWDILGRVTSSPPTLTVPDLWRRWNATPLRHDADGAPIEPSVDERVRSDHWKQRPDLSSANRGVHRPDKKRMRADRGGGRTGVLSPSVQDSAAPSRKRVAMTGNGQGGGVHAVTLARQIVDLSGDSGAAGRGIHARSFSKRTGGLFAYMRALSDRLRRVRVCCGDWSRVLGPAVTTCIGTTAVFLDPPYHSPGDERAVCYTHDAADVWHAAHEWAVANGHNPLLRIALCGYEGAAEMPSDWIEVPWRSAGGYGRSERGKANRDRERVWFSPHCLGLEQMHLVGIAP